MSEINQYTFSQQYNKIIYKRIELQKTLKKKWFANIYSRKQC